MVSRERIFQKADSLFASESHFLDFLIFMNFIKSLRKPKKELYWTEKCRRDIPPQAGHIQQRPGGQPFKQVTSVISFEETVPLYL